MSDRLLPYDTIIKAHEGDPIAIQTVLDRYAGYIRLPAASDRAGCCHGHGLGLHLPLRRSHSRAYPGNTGHRSAWPVSPAEPSLRHRAAPAAAFPPEAFPVSGASSGSHFQCRCRSPGSNALYSDTSSGHRQLLHAQQLRSSPAHLLLPLQSDLFYKHRDISS